MSSSRITPSCILLIAAHVPLCAEDAKISPVTAGPDPSALAALRADMVRAGATHTLATQPVQAPRWASEFTHDDFGARAIVAIPNAAPIAFRYCPPSIFVAGSTDSEPDHQTNEIRHTVTLTKPYWIAETELTQGTWKSVMPKNPSASKGDPTLPVEQVSFGDAQEFLSHFNALFKDKCVLFRLPTDAEWEYAGRAGTDTAYVVPTDKLDLIAWHSGNSGGHSHPVASLAPNPWGLFDMQGNVWEWCSDWYGEPAADALTDPQGPESGPGHVRHGGGWKHEAKRCRSAYRECRNPNYKGAYFGFRIVAQSTDNTVHP